MKDKYDDNKDEKKDLIDSQVENFKYATSLIKILVGFIGLIVFMYSKNAFIFFSAAILPSIVIIFTDRGSHKCLSATVSTFNLIGIMPYLKQLWNSHSIHDTASRVISDPMAWLLVYFTTFMGFLIYLSFPSIIAQIYVAKANMRITKLIEHRKKICTEWGINLEDNKDNSIDKL